MMAARKYTWKSDGKKHSIPESKHKANARAAGRSTNTVSAADYVTLGPNAAEIKSQTSPARWKQIVNAAHKQGWTIASALDSSTPAALKQKTAASLRSAAERTIRDAYAPAEDELAGAQASADGLRAKRLQDQQSYDQWHAQKAAQIAGAINDAQSKYLDTVKTATAQTAQRENDRQAALQAQAQQGAVGDMSNSVILKGAAERADQTKQRAEADVTAAAAQTPIVAQRAGAVQASAMGAAYQRRAQIEGDYNKATSDITSSRMDLKTKKAADQVKEYSSLLQTEMDKASSNRDFQSLQSQLQSKEDIAKLKHEEFLVGQKGLNKRAGLAAATTRRGQDVTAATTKRGQDITSADKAADRATRSTIAALDRAAKLKISANADKSKKTGPAARKASRSAVQAVNTLAQLIRQGTFVGTDGKRHKANAGNLISLLGASSDQVNVAVRLARGRPGKTALFNPGRLGILPDDVGLLH